MNCREAQRHLSADRDGALENHQRAALVVHVGQCQVCRQFRDTLEVVVVSWRQANGRAPSPDAELEWQKLRREIRGGVTASSSSRRMPLLWFAAPLAAAAAIAAMVFLNPFTPASTPATKSAVPQVASAAAAKSSEHPTVVFVDDKSGYVFVYADEPVRQI